MRFGCLALGWTAVAVTACCPPPDPEEPHAIPPAAPAPKAAAAGARTMPPAIVSRFERPDATPRKPAAKQPEREMLKEPPLVPPARPKTEIEPRRETVVPPAPTERPATLPDDVVIGLLETGKAAFVRCFKKAIAADPTVMSFKVHVRVELDGDGAIVGASADTTDKELAGCLSRATGWLRFPATGKRVVVDLPLFYRGQ